MTAKRIAAAAAATLMLLSGSVVVATSADAALKFRAGVAQS